MHDCLDDCLDALGAVHITLYEEHNSEEILRKRVHSQNQAHLASEPDEGSSPPKNIGTDGSGAQM
jgi:hypothetical protein